MNKNISAKSSKLLDYFNQLSIDCFNFDEASKALPESSETAIRELLRDMTLRGLLMRPKSGVFYIIPYEQDPEYFMPDWHLLSGHLVRNTDHYIGYYSALQLHNLVTQPSLKQQMVVPKQIRPSSIEIKGVQFQFIYHNEKHFFGSKKYGSIAFTKLNVQTLKRHLLIVFLNRIMPEE